MTKEINIKIAFNDTNDKIATGIRLIGFDETKISDVLTLIGVMENLKQQQMEKLKELASLER